MDQLTIRKVKNSDFEPIYQFVCALEEQVFDKSKQAKILRENIENPNNIYLIATVGEDAAGFLSCHAQNLLHHGGLVGEIQEMYIVPEHRSLGIGQKLLDFLKELAASKKIIQLEVTSNVKRKKAHEFYLNTGFLATHSKFVCQLSPSIVPDAEKPGY